MKRRWFQMHLSTTVALSFMAGVLIWANVFNWPPERITPTYEFQQITYGWPYVFWRPGQEFYTSEPDWNFLALLKDIFVWVMLLFLVGSVLEGAVDSINKVEAPKP
jgi:hypothetical protein